MLLDCSLKLNVTHILLPNLYKKISWKPLSLLDHRSCMSFEFLSHPNTDINVCVLYIFLFFLSSVILVYLCGKDLLWVNRDTNSRISSLFSLHLLSTCLLSGFLFAVCPITVGQDVYFYFILLRVHSFRSMTFVLLLLKEYIYCDFIEDNSM